MTSRSKRFQDSSLQFQVRSLLKSEAIPIRYNVNIPVLIIFFFFIIFLGGRDGLKTLNNLECFDPKTGEWTTLSPMLTHRHGVGVAVLSGPIYAVGGHDGWSYLNTVER